MMSAAGPFAEETEMGQQRVVPSTRELAQAAKSASRKLAPLSEAKRNAALEAMAAGLEASEAELLAANAEDMAHVAQLTGEAALPSATLARLKLDGGKLREMITQVRSVAALPDPLGRVLDAVELDDGNPEFRQAESEQAEFRQAESEQAESGQADPRQADPREADPGQPDASGGNSGHSGAHSTRVQRAGPSAQTEAAGLHLQKISVPLGVLAVIFEARPDAVTQIAALALKSGNAVLLKPGREVEHTASALVRILREALRGEGLPEDAVSLVLGRERAAELLQLHELVDLVLPRGSSALVRYVQAHTHIPVLGHAEGICHIYVDREFSPELALRVIEDAKTDYPAACNAVETVLLHREIAAEFLPVLARRLRARRVLIHADAEARAVLCQSGQADTLPVEDWHAEYGELELALGVVDSLDAAIDHIHRHGSLHTESILTEDDAAAERFLREVDAAGVYHNASTRFADGFRYGFGAEVGVSTSKFHARGPVGLDGLTSYKYVLRGHGHTAGEYRGAKARMFTHRR